MKLAILGAGSVGRALGQAWANQGHQVIFGVRDVNAPKTHHLLEEIGKYTQAATLIDAVKQADILVLALTWDAMPEVVGTLGDLTGKIILDCTNPLAGNRLDTALDLGHSGGEQVALWFPGTKVVKIFNRLVWK